MAIVPTVLSINSRDALENLSWCRVVPAVPVVHRVGRDYGQLLLADPAPVDDRLPKIVALHSRASQQVVHLNQRLSCSDNNNTVTDTVADIVINTLITVITNQLQLAWYN